MHTYTTTVSASSDAAEARSLRESDNAMCFVTRSLNFPVYHEPEIVPADSLLCTSSRGAGNGVSEIAGETT